MFHIHFTHAGIGGYMKTLVITEEIWKEGTMYTAYCPELDFVSCGRNVEEARNNLLEVIGIQVEEMTQLGTLKTFLADTGPEIAADRP